jgi:putative nucleotidyltransferase with HDIG domain
VDLIAATLAGAVDARDSYTRSHCGAVSELAAAIAEGIGLDGDHVARIRRVGLLHDVGKIASPTRSCASRAA